MKASQCYFTCVDINRNKWFDKECNVKRNEFKQRYMSLIVIELKNQN